MDWVELVAPSAAILALFLAIGLVVQSVRHGRAIKRLEERLAQNGSAAVEASLDRVKQLQARADISSGRGGLPPGAVRTGLIAAGVVVAIGLVGAGGWFFLLRDDGGSGTATAGDTTEAAGTAPEAVPTTPVDPGGTVPDDPPPVENPALFDVAVFNASGVTGAAGEGAAPLLDTEGWNVLEAFVTDEPNQVTDLEASVVQFSEGNRAAANAVAADLEIEDISPLDGYTADQIGGADVVVLVGQDIAERLVP